MSLIALIGTGTVFGADQPVNFRLAVNSKKQISPLWLSSGFSIPNTIHLYDQAEFDTPSVATTVLTDLNLAIIAAQSTKTIQSIAEKFAALIPASETPPTPATLKTTIPTPYANTKVFITTPSITEGCEIFARLSSHPNTALIHGFALHYETLLLSQLVTKVNDTIFQKNLEKVYPYLNIKSIHNVILRSRETSKSTDEPRHAFDLTHAVIANYPTPSSLTPLAALLKLAQIQSEGETGFPATKDQVQSDLNPLSPFPLLLAQHLRLWLGFTPRGVYFNACIAVKNEKTFQLRPIATYYGNSSSSILFD